MDAGGYGPDHRQRQRVHAPITLFYGEFTVGAPADWYPAGRTAWFYVVAALVLPRLR